MKASKLIERLKFFVEIFGDFNVDLNNSKGIYEKIVDIKSRNWIDDKQNNHCSIELIHDRAGTNEDTD